MNTNFFSANFSPLPFLEPDPLNKPTPICNNLFPEEDPSVTLPPLDLSNINQDSPTTPISKRQKKPKRYFLSNSQKMKLKRVFSDNSYRNHSNKSKYIINWKGIFKAFPYIDKNLLKTIVIDKLRNKCFNSQS